MLNMSLSNEEENFIRISKIILEVVPKYLRGLFIERWNQRYPNTKWQSDIASGNYLFNEIPNEAKKGRNEVYAKNMQSGNENDWDTTTLVYVMLYSKLNLIPSVRPDGQRSVPLLISEEIDIMRKVRNEFFAHASSMQCSTATFIDIASKIKSVAKNAFGADAEHEIDNIAKSQISTKMADQLKHQLDIEKNRNDEFESALNVSRSVTVIHAMPGSTVIAGDIGHLSNNQCQPYTQQNIDQLKATYIDLYEKHQIHIAEEDGRIKLKEVDINDFAVKLKMRRDLPPEDTFRNEIRQHLEFLRNMESENAELSRLIDEHNRVTFIRGVAGMGKSVLSKQLACGWSHNIMYTDFKLCIVFECREINVFQATKGAHLKNHELLEEFVRTKFNFDLEDGKGVLFVMDGLDELFDIRTDNSIIKQLLCRKIYPSSKVIITGRPHVESKLEECGEIGGLQKVEIQGLSDEQIEEYVNKFPSPQGFQVDLSKAKNSSNRFLPVMHVPQFLNTFCCFATLLKGEAIYNGAELYCWTIYLLLKQHADKRDTRKTKLISDIFHEYSKELLTLGQVCYKLLNENKLIIIKEDIERFLDGCGRGKEFIDSFFVDVSDDFTRKLQFKHLTLMEFFSAFHVCSIENCIEVIKENLKRGFIEVVLFACQLIAGLNCRVVVKEMMALNAEKFEQVNMSVFCCDVVKALQDCKFDEKMTFVNSMDIILSLLNKDVAEREVFISTVKLLKIKDLDLNVENSKKLYCIYEHLLDKCKCDENDMRVVFENIRFRWLDVNDLDIIQCVEYLRYVAGIELSDMKLNISSVRHEFAALSNGKCTKVDIRCCEIEDNEIEHESYASRLDVLGIVRCKLRNVSSLINAFHWVTLSLSSSSSHSSRRVLQLWWLVTQDGWWSELVKAIELEKAGTGYLKLKKLDIYKCTPQMSEELQMRILECGVELVIDRREVHFEELASRLRHPSRRHRQQFRCILL